MKIRKVKWNNHPVLGNLELDFTDATDLPYETVLFAGENGAGKTIVLESISTFLNKGSFAYFDFIEYESEGKILTAVQPDNSNIDGFYDMIDGGNRIHMRTNRNNVNADVDNNPLNIRFSGCILSKARADYKTTPIKSTSTSQLDESKYETDQKDDFTSLKQLIVDIENQDNSEYAQLNKGLGDSPKKWHEYYPESKIYRFKNAFDNFFENLEYDRVIDSATEKKLLFKKHGKSISIDDLSTGEKQIVFRGSYLLRNIGQLETAAIFIDEPELSMHPKWQQNILKYYKDLFKGADGLKSQLFFASHSEHVLKYALSDSTKNLVIVLLDNNGTIENKRIDAPNVLPSITSAETNYLVFDLVSNDYHIELYGYLQNKESLNSVKACDDFIKASPHFVNATHGKASTNPNGTTFDTLCTYIRNAIDHPAPARTFTEDELRISTELLIELCR